MATSMFLSPTSVFGINVEKGHKKTGRVFVTFHGMYPTLAIDEITRLLGSIHLLPGDQFGMMTF